MPLANGGQVLLGGVAIPDVDLFGLQLPRICAALDEPQQLLRHTCTPTFAPSIKALVLMGIDNMLSGYSWQAPRYETAGALGECHFAS